MTTPNPGTKEAIEKGCKCPVMDNKHGIGAYWEDGKPIFWYSYSCELHKEEILMDARVFVRNK